MINKDQNKYKNIKTYYHSGVNMASEDEMIIDISTALGRQAEKLVVINDGSDKMFVKAYDSNKYPSKEVWIYPNHRRVFNKVSKLLIGKTEIGNTYRVSEYTNLIENWKM